MEGMYSPILKCSNETCSNHLSPIKTLFVKKGKGKGLGGKSYQRYQCKLCKSTFSTRSLNWMGDFRRPELVKEVYALYTSGCSIRRMAIDLKTTKATITNIIKTLADKCHEYHQNYIDNGFIDTNVVFFDEMESFEQSKALPVSIGIAVDIRSKKIIDARVAEIKCKGKLKLNIDKIIDLLPAHYATRKNYSPQMRYEVMKEIKKCLRDGGTIYTDDKRAYLSLISSVFGGRVLHIHSVSKSIKSHPNPFAFGRFSSVCANIRSYMSRMGRRTLITTKKKEMLQAHLWMFICRYNGYDIDEILKQDWFEGKTYERTLKKAS